MAPVVPDPRRIKSFASEAAFERWLAANHDRQPELWLKIHKRASGKPTVSYAQALDVALCWGWIDGLKKSFDEHSFLQRFTPRRPKSIWSQINREHIARLTRAGRMKPPGQHQVDVARADGRWAAAYAPIRATTTASVPADLRAAIDADARARKAFATISRTDLFALVFRTRGVTSAAARRKKIASLVAALASRGTITGRIAKPKRSPARGGRRPSGER